MSSINYASGFNAPVSVYGSNDTEQTFQTVGEMGACHIDDKQEQEALELLAIQRAKFAHQKLRLHQEIGNIKQTILETEQEIEQIQDKLDEYIPAYEPEVFILQPKLIKTKDKLRDLKYREAAAIALMQIIVEKASEMVSEVELVKCYWLRDGSNRYQHMSHSAPVDCYYIEKICTINGKQYSYDDIIEVVQPHAYDKEVYPLQPHIPDGVYTTLEEGKKAFLSNNEAIELEYKSGELQSQEVDITKARKTGQTADKVKMRYIQNLELIDSEKNLTKCLLLGAITIDGIEHTVTKQVVCNLDDKADYQAQISNWSLCDVPAHEITALINNNRLQIHIFNELIDRLAFEIQFEPSTPVEQIIAKYPLIRTR